MATKLITSERGIANIDRLIDFLLQPQFDQQKNSCCLILTLVDLLLTYPSTFCFWKQNVCVFQLPPPSFFRYLGVGLPQWSIECFAYGGVIEGKFGREFFGEVSRNWIDRTVFVWINHFFWRMFHRIHGCYIYGSYGIRHEILWCSPSNGLKLKASKDPLPQLE